MRRVCVIGGNGAGKTEFSRRLAELTGLPLVHLDALYWRDNWQPAPREEFLALLQAELDKPAWILDGNMKRTLPHRLTYCDTVIWLDYSAPVCFCGAVKRIIRNYGRTRPDMGGNCPESFDKQKRQFLRSVWTFNRKNRPDFEQMTAEAEERGVTVIRLKNRRQGEKVLREIGQK